MRKKTTKATSALIEIIEMFNKYGKMVYSSKERQYLGVYHATKVEMFLKHYGYMDEYKQMIKRFENPEKAPEMLSAFVSEYCAKRKENKVIRPSKKYRPLTLKINDTKEPEQEETKPLDEYPDETLVNELRTRGFTVTATKTIEL